MRLAQAVDSSRFGGKAASLALLVGQGLPVPSAFCISAYQAERLDGADLSEIVASISVLGADHLAVRSSANIEDGTRASLAGLFKSALHVTADISNVERAIRSVVTSATAPAVDLYLRRLDMAKPIKMSVIVQEMVFPTISGVIFTADPITGEPNLTLEVATPESGDVEAGRGSPRHLSLSRRSMADGVFPDEPIAPLTGAQLKELASRAIECEQILGAAQDIEWAFETDRLWILQSRPITTSLRFAGQDAQ